jgi:Protein of unknown function (DUF3309)
MTVNSQGRIPKGSAAEPFPGSKRLSDKSTQKEHTMSLVLVILLILLLLGGIGTYPGWGYSSGWGYGPSGLLGLVLIVLLVLALVGRSPI